MAKGETIEMGRADRVVKILRVSIRRERSAHISPRKAQGSDGGGTMFAAGPVVSTATTASHGRSC